MYVNKYLMAFASYTFNGTNEGFQRTNATVNPNAIVFTLSFWMKPSAILGGQFTNVIFQSQDSEFVILFFDTAQDMNIGRGTFSFDWFEFAEPAEIEVDAWHHWVIRFDSSQAVADNRLRFYLDGVQQTDTVSVAIGLNEAHNVFLNGNLFEFAKAVGGGFFQGKMAFIDCLEGVSAAPTDFAFDDGGTWTRKEYTGSYGNYGFSLDGSSFNDVGPNGLDFTPVNMDGTNLDAVDLPPFEAGVEVLPTGIEQAVAFGTAQVQVDQTISIDNGIAQSVAFGTPNLNLQVNLTGVDAVTFGGADTLDSSALTGTTDTDKALVSLWMKPVTATETSIFHIGIGKNGTVRIDFFENLDNTFDLNIVGFTDTGSINLTSSAIAYGEWAHVLISYDISEDFYQIYVNDELSASGTLATTGIFDYTDLPTVAGATFGPVRLYIGDLAELYINFDAALDLSLEANRRKFITGSLKPANLGINGSLPTGDQPVIYFSGNSSEFPINKGYGGAFTQTGSLSDAILVARGGIAQASTFGTAQVNLTAKPTGIAQSVGFGTPTLVFDQSISIVGIEQAIAFGDVNASQQQVIGANGIVQSITFGLPQIDLTLYADGITQAVALGAPQLDFTLYINGIEQTTGFGTSTIGLKLLTTGIAQPVTFGSSQLNLTVRAQGIEQTVSFGTASVNLEVLPTGIAQPIALGQPQLDLTIHTDGIVQTVAFGTSQINQTISVTGIAQSVGFGDLQVNQTVSITGIAQPTVFGAPTVIFDQFINVDGISQSVAFGMPDLSGNVIVDGIEVTVTFGTAQLDLELLPTSIEQPAAFGSPSVNLRIIGQGIAQSIGLGTPSLTSTRNVTGQAIDVQVLFGAPLMAKRNTINVNGITQPIVFGVPGGATERIRGGAALLIGI